MIGTESFGRWLKRRRKALEVTQSELAQRVGCAVVTIRKIEADELRPSRHIAERLADQLGLVTSDRAAFIAHARGEIAPRRHNLPTPATPLIGRADEVAAVCALLRGETRLLTLTGAPGIGKTRLGLQSAAALLEDFVDGVFFIELAPISSPALALPTIAQVLGVRERSQQRLIDQVVEYLRDKRLLLLLDNFEHVLPSAPQIAELLTASPAVKVLITSRTVLHLLGEHVIVMPPLRLMSPAELHDERTDFIAAAARVPAITLFVERARAISPAFALTEANARAVAAICAQLDGIPLAIELAAARCRMFSPPTLLVRLERRLDLLTKGALDLPPRQQTLRDTIDWSYQLLDEAGRGLFRRLAVFAGGCTLDAAEAVAGVPHPDTAALDGSPNGAAILDHLTTLLDNNLVYQEVDDEGEPRFVMLETIREYALELLAASGERAALHSRHSAYYVALAEAAEPHLQGAEQVAWLNRLETEHDNIRAALDWSRTGEGDPQDGLRLAGAIWIFWQIHNYIGEGRARLAAALAAAPQPTLARARALNGAGYLARCQHDLAQAATLLEAGVTLFRSLGDQRGAAQALNNLGSVAIDQHDYQRATALCEESLALCRALGDTVHSAWALINLGHVALQERNHERSLRLHTESLALFEKLRGKRGMASALSNLARMSYVRHDYRKAAALYEESLALSRALDDRQSVAWALVCLGEVALAQGDWERAAALIDQGLPQLRVFGNKQRIATALSMLGLAAEIRGDPAEARARYDEGLALFQEVGDQAGIARAILGRGYVALIERDEAAAHHFFDTYATLGREQASDLMIGLGVCIRDAALAQMDWDRSVTLLECDLAHFQEQGNQWGACIALHLMGLILLWQGHNGRAWECYQRSLALARAIDDLLGIPMRLAGLASAALGQGGAEQAARLCGAAEAIQETLGPGLVITAMIPIDREQYARTLERVRSGLADPALERCWAEGRALSIEEAVAYALGDRVVEARRPGSAKGMIQMADDFDAPLEDFGE